MDTSIEFYWTLLSLLLLRVDQTGRMPHLIKQLTISLSERNDMNHFNNPTKCNCSIQCSAQASSTSADTLSSGFLFPLGSGEHFSNGSWPGGQRRNGDIRVWRAPVSVLVTTSSSSSRWVRRSPRVRTWSADGHGQGWNHGDFALNRQKMAF